MRGNGPYVLLSRAPNSDHFESERFPTCREAELSAPAGSSFRVIFSPDQPDARDLGDPRQYRGRS